MTNRQERGITQGGNMWKAGDYANIPSGMGGSFSVKILDTGDERCSVVVLNPGFEGWKLTPKNSELCVMDEETRKWHQRKDSEARALATRQAKRRW